jgi:FAD:protein FMN transferase
MSFQDSQSDVSRLNREAFRHPQEVYPATFEVLLWAQQIAETSEGCFDISIAADLVHKGILPAPQSRHAPDPDACWRDIELRDDGSVGFRRPLWIDLSGIAKGYAVDRAIEKLQSHGVERACVNAGGDLRVYGSQTEQVLLRQEHASRAALPVLEIENAALASSGDGPMPGAHVNPKSLQAVPGNRFASVMAESCLIADALTKPVLILQERSTALLRHYGASAHLHDPQLGWRYFPETGG